MSLWAVMDNFGLFWLITDHFG